MTSAGSYDYIVVGAGSAGCAVAAGLSEGGNTVAVIEAGPSDAHPFVKMPFGLVWLMGSRRDWQFKSAPQAALGGRQIGIPRGRMVGGSGSINSMVWFRGRAADFDDWNVPGWAWSDVAPAFDAVEARMTPTPLAVAHPLTRRLSRLFGANADRAPHPDLQSGGVFSYNMRGGKRWSAANGFLRGARHVTVITGSEVARLNLSDKVANGVTLKDGSTIAAKRGVVLSAGSIGSPAILLQSGIGPADDLQAAGIPVVLDAPGVGANLHDHPGVGLHFVGAGYGLTPAQALQWMLAPFNYILRKRGPFASPTVEGGMFFNARDDGATPDVQSHFIPFMLNWTGRRYGRGAGCFADVCLCRPRSRGALRITPDGLSIDLGLLTDPTDLETLVAGLKRLRLLMAEALGDAVTEAYPGPDVADDAALRDYVRNRCGTAYHPVGTLRMGAGDAPVTPGLALRGIDRLWVADASVMPAVTSANTNAPSIMIGHRAADFIKKAS